MNSDIVYLELRKKFEESEINFSLLDNLIKKENIKTISFASTIQYLNLAKIIKSYLENKGINIIIKKGQIYEGQVLGCNSQAFDKDADLLLLLADGKFHALNNAVQLNREVYIFNTRSIEKITKEDIEKENRKIKAKKTKFLSATKIGLLVSTKKGQHYNNIQNLIKKIKDKRKQVYLFESDNINIAELDNFDLSIYINSACPGLAMDDLRIINLKDILEFLE